MFKQKNDSSAAPAKVESADAVQAARTRARHRLIGAIVLLAIGIIGFPLVFETQPRPVPIDIPIEIPRRDAAPPLAMPQSRLPAAAPRATEERSTAPGVAGREQAPVESRAEAGRDVAPPRAPTVDRSASRVAAAPAGPAAQASAAEPARRASGPALASRPVEPSPAIAQGDGERARALLEGRQTASAAQGTRFVLQVGAFADAEAARDTRRQVEKLGLKTYTQVAQTAAGNRIRVRVGPFSSRGEADAALAKAKAAGLAAVVLTL